MPHEVPAIIWRAGLDLNPIDAADPDARVHRLGAQSPNVLPHVTKQIPYDIDINGRFVVSLDDRALALAQPHGHILTWL